MSQPATDTFHRYEVLVFYESLPTDLAARFQEAGAQLPSRLASDPETTTGSCHGFVESDGADSGPPARWILDLEPELDAEALRESAEQSWAWREGADLLERCTAAVSLSDDRNTSLDAGRRLGAFQCHLAALLGIGDPMVIVWLPSQQLVEPAEFLSSVADDHFSNPTGGAINVRLFQLPPELLPDSGEQALLMDTMGLGALGLPDLQCIFRGLEPMEVAPILFDTAVYIYEQGPKIRDGDTVQGPRDDDKWSCTYSESLAEPDREAVLLDPGFPFSVQLEGTAAN